MARNDGAKRLGIKMGAPLFELQDMVDRGEVICFSSNYSLYQSLSDRIMAIIAERSPDHFVYSIDESFADLTGVQDPFTWASETQAIIKARTGMPVGIGIGPTKTLAKLANWAAKKWKHKTGCIVDLMDPVRQEKLLRYAPVGEVWGVGSRTAARLAELGIKTAWDLASADPKRIRKHLNVNIERTARELAGIVCFPLHEDAGKKQMIACTRSFGNRLTTLAQMNEAVVAYTCNASEKARRQQSLVTCLQVFLRTSAFAPEGQRYSRSIVIQPPYPTADSRVLTAAALGGVRAIFRPGFAYAKAGVILTQLIDQEGQTSDLFTPGDSARSERLMGVLDSLNRNMGRGTLKLARDVGTKPWSMRQQRLSPNYMSNWNDLPKVRC